MSHDQELRFWVMIRIVTATALWIWTQGEF